MSKVNYKSMTVQELKDHVNNILFPGDDGEVEHVDMSFEEFTEMLNWLINKAFKHGPTQ